MRTCSLCNTQSPDSAARCTNCGADLNQHSVRAIALEKFKKYPRVTLIRGIVAKDAYPACRSVEGDYSKEQVPKLHVPGCSHANGCRCFYEPMLVNIVP